MNDKIYVKDLEKIIAKQERKILKLEKEKMSRERAAAIFAEYFIVENDTIPGGLASDMRSILRRFKYYPQENQNVSNFVAEIDCSDYKSLEKAIKKLFCVELKDLRQYGLHINTKNDSSNISHDGDRFPWDNGPVFL